MTRANLRRYKELERFLTLTSKTGYVNVKPIVSEMERLLQLDTDVVIAKVRLL